MIDPTTPHTQHPTAITRTRFRLFHFRSPLLTEYLFQLVLRCFTSQRSHPRTMNSHAGDQTQLWPGSPIRTSSDQHSLANSPRHIAGCNVLLRPFMPRHPPNALKHLQNKKHTPAPAPDGLKRLEPHTTTQPQQPEKPATTTTIIDSTGMQRCSHPLYNSQTPHQHPTPARRNLSPTRGRFGYRTQEPNSMPSMSQTPHNTHSQHLHE